MCDCIYKTKERLTEKLNKNELPEWKPKATTLISVHCDNTPYRMPDFKPTLTIPFIATWSTSKATTKKTTIAIEASFCPFCGVAFDSGSDGKAVESKFEEDSK